MVRCKSARLVSTQIEYMEGVMSRQVLRIGVAIIAMFYVVIGGLWATSYFPLQKLYATQDTEKSYTQKFGYEKWYESPEYEKVDEYRTTYALTKPDIFVTEARLSLYQSILLWGTVALGAGAVVLFLTRGKRVG